MPYSANAGGNCQVTNSAARVADGSATGENIQPSESGALISINAQDKCESKVIIKAGCFGAAMFKLSSVLPLFLRFFVHPCPRIDVADIDAPAMISPYMMMPDDHAMCKVRDDMDIAMSRAEPCAPIFEVEAIDFQGYARLFAGLHLHEAIKISADFEDEAQPGREPRVYIPAAHLGVGLTDD